MRSLDLNATKKHIFFFFFCEKNSTRGSSRSSLSLERFDRANSGDVRGWRQNLVYRGPSPASIYQWSLDSKPLEATSTTHPLAFFSTISYSSTTDSLNVNHASAGVQTSRVAFRARGDLSRQIFGDRWKLHARKSRENWKKSINVNRTGRRNRKIIDFYRV